MRRWTPTLSTMLLASVLVLAVPPAVAAPEADEQATSEGSTSEEASEAEQGGGDESEGTSLGDLVAGDDEDSERKTMDVPGSDRSLHVVVGPGRQSRDPIAVPAPRCREASSSSCEKVAEILRETMTLSFLFQVLPPRSYIADPDEGELEDVAWKDWTNVGARYLVVAEVQGPAPYDLEFRLAKVASRSVLRVEGQSQQDVARDDLREAVHRFANGVLGAVSGTRGVFDTRIAYSIRRGPGVKNVETMLMDGGRQRTVVSNGSINMLPAWGFGGILYTSFQGGRPSLYLDERRLAQGDGHFRQVAVAPDGSRMIASISFGGQSDLYVLSRDGEVRRNLTDSPADEVSPTFAPDGERIAYVSSASGGPQIYVMDLEDGSSRRLTMKGDYNYAPDWGPDGRIVFAGMDEGVSDLFTVDSSRNIRRLTQNQGSNKEPTWSPKGRYIAFIATRSSDRGGSGLWLMSADGRYQYRIARGGGYGALSWEP